MVSIKKFFRKTVKPKEEPTPVVEEKEIDTVVDADLPDDGIPKKEVEKIDKEMVKKTKTDNDYFNMVNPATGKRYSIPMLSPTSKNYRLMYIYYMKMKESKPEAFQRVLDWA